MKYAKIIGTGSYLPEKILTNHDFEQMVDTSHEWIITRTGIEERHIAQESETVLSMGIAAAKQALGAANVLASDIDLIIVTTVTPQYFFPSTACLLQTELGCQNDCMAFDLNAACSGFIYAVDVARQYIASGRIKHALIVSSEMLSRIVDWKDRNTCVLFGDGAGAVVLSVSDEPGIIDGRLHARGKEDILYMHTGLFCESDEKNYLQMQGRELFKVIVEAVRSSIATLLESNNMQISDVDWMIPHQANARIIDKVSRLLQFPRERVIMTLSKHANTSSASIPLALDQAVRSGQVKSGQTLVLEAFGAGLTWGGLLLRY